MDSMTQEEQQTNSHNMVILNKLGDIQTSIAVNNSETSNIKNKVEEIKVDLKELKQKVEFQNGRVRTLEDWSNEAKKIIESNSQSTSETKESLVRDQTKIWTAIKIIYIILPILLALAGTVAYYKAKDIAIEAVTQALQDNVDHIEYAK